MAFRFDRPRHTRNPNPNPSLSSDSGIASGQGQGRGGRVGAAGSLSFVIHQHRAALSGGDESRGDEEGSAGSGLGLVVPNSLSVRLEPDGEGGCQVSVRYGNLRDPRCSCLVYGSLKDYVYWALNVCFCAGFVLQRRWLVLTYR